MRVKLHCVPTILLVLAGSAYAQQRAVTETEVESLLNKALEKRKLVPYRITKLEVIHQTGLRIKSVTEHMPPRRARSVVERRDQTGKTRKERIWTDELRYEKVGSGPWSVFERARPGAEAKVSDESGTVTTGTLTDEKIEQKFEYLGRDDLDGKPTDVYKKVRKVTTELPIGRITVIETTRYWLSDQGMLLKEVSEGSAGNRQRAYTTTTDFEYDPTIKIEAPIL